MDKKKPETCSVCYDNYDEALRRPRSLPCGNTFCQPCIDNTVENANLTCPSCRVHKGVTATTLFPVKLCVEDFVRKLKSIQATSGSIKKFRSLKLKHKSSISSLITGCEEILSQLDEYRGQLGAWKTRHHQLQDRLVELNTAACELLDQEDTRVVNYTTQGEEGKEQLEAILLCINTNTVTTDDVDNTSDKAEDWIHRCQQLFPDYNTVHTSMMVQETIMEALEMRTTETGATAATVHLGETGATSATVHLGETGATAATVHLGETGVTAANVHLGETGATAATVHLGETGATAATVNLGETCATAPTVHLGETGATAATVLLGETGATAVTVHLGVTGATVHLGETGATAVTVHLGVTGATVHLGETGATAVTVHLGVTGATVHLGETGATAATVHLVVTAATVHLGETGATTATVHLGETDATSATDHLGETGATAATEPLGETGATAATVHLGVTAATVHLGETGATAATVHLGETGAIAATVHLGETGAIAATVHLGETAATAATVHLGVTAATVHLGETSATAATVHLGETAATDHLRDSTITEIVSTITGRFYIDQLTVEDLRRMSEPVKRLVEAGRVVALQQDQDGRRSAKITLQDGQLYLHSLLRQHTPANSHALQESEVVGVLDPSCTQAFLDLEWAGLTRGRVTIRLTPDTPLARQFVLLCTGQRGHTFHNTKLLRVFRKGQPGEWVHGGDYESNDGDGGASLLPDLDDEYRMSGRAGAVWSVWPGSDLGAQFIIVTRDRQDGRQYPQVFGEVVSGLDVLRAAVNHSDITEVTVVDCGVVLPH